MMSYNDEEGEDELYYGSDDDGGFEEDMEALRRACLLTGRDDLLKAAATASEDNIGSNSANNSDDFEKLNSNSPDDNGDDDFETLRAIWSRFGSNLDDDFETLIGSGNSDDFETLRAIQRRFAAYTTEEGGFGLGEITDYNLDKINNDPDASTKEDIEEEEEACCKVSGCTGNQPFSDSDSSVNQSSSSTLPNNKGSYFPKAAQAFVDAIKKNRSCQKLIRTKLLNIDARIEELKKLNERVKILKDFQATCSRIKKRRQNAKQDARYQLLSVPKLSSANNKLSPILQYGPVENSRVANYREALEKFSLSATRNKWSKKENEKLSDGVKQQFQKMLLQRSVDLLSGDEGDDACSSDKLDSIVASIVDLDITPDKMRQFLPNVNWDELASMYLPGRRSGAECQTRWLNFEDPLINQKPWTKTEEKNLLHVLQQKGLSNWIDIAVSMGTNRTPFHCLARYQRSLNASIMKREWTKEEDEQLRAAVEAFGEGNWQVVASNIVGRTGTQCSNRWMKTLHPAKERKGRFTSEEDKRLKVAVTLFGPGTTWNKIAEFVPGRTSTQCSDRWKNCLDPSLNMGEWTPEEDLKLEAAIEENRYSWSKVAKCVGHRTDSQCLRRWKQLFPHQVPLLQAAKKMKRAALVSNFVDRESERPALGPCDFVPLSEDTEQLTNDLISKRKGKKRKSRMSTYSTAS